MHICAPWSFIVERTFVPHLGMNLMNELHKRCVYLSFCLFLV